MSHFGKHPRTGKPCVIATAEIKAEAVTLEAVDPSVMGQRLLLLLGRVCIGVWWLMRLFILAVSILTIVACIPLYDYAIRATSAILALINSCWNGGGAMRTRLRSWWRNIKLHRVTIQVVVIIPVVIIALIILGHRFDWTGFTGKTLWGWLNLLGVLAIPVLVGFGAVWFTTRQGKVIDAENKDNQRENALQAYIDKMSELLLKEHLGELTPNGKLKPEYVEVRKIARIRTLTVLRSLDKKRKGSVLLFLKEAGLINKDKVILDLSGADFREVYLIGADLSQVNLSKVYLIGADLSYTVLDGTVLIDAYLSWANLIETSLRGTDLSRASLRGAYLSKTDPSETTLPWTIIWGPNFQPEVLGADLSHANLSNVDLTYANLNCAVLNEADLNYAVLSEADLSIINLEGSDLSGANLYKADLHGANLCKVYLKGVTGITIEELEKQAKSLKGATMPDGSIHE